MNVPTLKSASLAVELWREYDYGGRVYRIDQPDTLYYRTDGTTHRIVDSKGIVHCVPAPGVLGCALRWKNKDGAKPVEF